MSLFKWWSRKKVVIVGHYASYAAAGELAKEFRRRPEWETLLVITRKDDIQFWQEYDAIFWPELSMRERRRISRFLHRADLTIVAGSPSLDCWGRIVEACPDERTGFKVNALTERMDLLTEFSRNHLTALMVTDSHLLINPTLWNGIYDQLAGVRVFAMPDLMSYVNRSPLYPFWPPVDCRSYHVERTKKDPIIVGHSPSKVSRLDQKGTEFIKTTAQQLDIPLQIITDLSHEEALKRKAHLDLFIDQISYKKFENSDWYGGLGKSGLEGLAFGCAVISSGSYSPTDPYFPLPPFIQVSRDTFEQEFKSLFDQPEKVREMGIESKIWAEKYVLPQPMVDHILHCVDLA